MPNKGGGRGLQQKRGSAPNPPATSNQPGVQRRTPRQAATNTGFRAGAPGNQQPSRGSAPDPPATSDHPWFRAGPPGNQQPSWGSAPDPPARPATNSGFRARTPGIHEAGCSKYKLDAELATGTATACKPANRGHKGPGGCTAHQDRQGRVGRRVETGATAGRARRAWTTGASCTKCQ